MNKRTALKHLFEQVADRRANKKVLVLLSGGIDSTVVLYLAQAAGMDVVALEFNYSGRPEIEIERNKKIAEHADVDFVRID